MVRCKGAVGGGAEPELVLSRQTAVLLGDVLRRRSEEERACRARNMKQNSLDFSGPLMWLRVQPSSTSAPAADCPQSSLLTAVYARQHQSQSRSTQSSCNRYARVQAIGVRGDKDST
jgi:hypothetical protein